MHSPYQELWEDCLLVRYKGDYIVGGLFERVDMESPSPLRPYEGTWREPPPIFKMIIGFSIMAVSDDMNVCLANAKKFKDSMGETGTIFEFTDEKEHNESSFATLGQLAPRRIGHRGS